jgi:NADH-quinone oxidoreductase subunit M
MKLGRALPFAAGTFAVAAFASMGLPGFSGFVAEFQVLIGAWFAFPTFGVLAGLGILIGVAYTLRALQKAFFGDALEAITESAEQHPLRKITLPERLGTFLLVGATVFVGLCPNFLLKLIGQSFDSPLFDGLRSLKNGGGF